MNMSAGKILSTEIGTDLHEEERQAFNQAFADHGLDWAWDALSFRMIAENTQSSDRVLWYANEVGGFLPQQSLLNSINQRVAALLNNRP